MYEGETAAKKCSTCHRIIRSCVRLSILSWDIIESLLVSAYRFWETLDLLLLCFHTINKLSNPYFVFCQVLNVNLSEGDKVVFEDVGHEENTMLANESILMRGLIVRSHSNQISIRLHSLGSRAGSVLLRYQCKSELQRVPPACCWNRHKYETRISTQKPT